MISQTLRQTREYEKIFEFAGSLSYYLSNADAQCGHFTASLWISDLQ